MSGEDWEQIRSIFEQALKVPAAERTPYVESVCGARRGLCQAVNELLEHYSGSGDEEGAKGKEPRVFAHGQKGARRFTIIRYIDRGGMGEVYEAYDERLRLSVALKTLHQDVIA